MPFKSNHFAAFFLQGFRRLLQIKQEPQSIQNTLLTLILALCCGLVGTLSFAPFSIWPALLVTISAAIWLLHKASTLKQAFYFGLFLGLGLFGSGVSWVYVSIAEYGQVGVFLAALATLLFVAVLAIFYACALQLAWWMKHKLPHWPLALIFTLSLFVTEFLRSTLFTGFPWLLLGYGFHTTWLFELAPLGGIWLLTFCAGLTLSIPLSLFISIRQSNIQQAIKQHALILMSTALLWGAGFYLQNFPVNWTQKIDTMQVSLVQGNISQDQKWLPENAQPNFDDYLETSLKHLDSDLIVWPETAITFLHNNIAPYFTEFEQIFNESNTTLVTGIPFVQQQDRQIDFYNAVWATGNGSGMYLKQRLVPFGEYIPLQGFVGKVLDIFGIPLESFQAGPADQAPLKIGNHTLATLICYEIAYPSTVKNMVPHSDLLLTVSNDAWFGNSIGPWQHLEIAQFRAKENGRFLLRTTNTGITAIINDQGEILSQLPQFERKVLTDKVELRQGLTPYTRYGDTLIVSLLMLLCFTQYLVYRHTKN